MAHWSEIQSPMPVASTVKVLAPTTFRSQKGCGDSIRDREIPGVKVCRKGQYDRSGLRPSGRGQSTPKVRS